MHIVIIGGGTVGQTLAERLDVEYNELQIVDEDDHVIEWAVEEDLSAIGVDDIRESADTLDVDLTTIIVVATAHDSANLLISQHIRNRFDVGRLIVRVNEPQNHSVFAELGLATVHATPVLAAALADAVRMVPESETDEQGPSQEEWV
jgi:trk system potassium uptake protein TrkA